MKKMLFATVALLGLAGTANAFTKAAPPLPVDNLTHLECVPNYEQPRIPDRNPVYKIEVTLQLNEVGKDVTELTAAHVLTDGTVHNRNDQYDHANVWQKQGFNEWYWKGTYNRDPNQKMGGRLYRSTEGQWVYEEMLFKSEQQVYFMSSRCHIDQDAE
jgi:hypothetical protein